jgi:hypothetical protein
MTTPDLPEHPTDAADVADPPARIAGTAGSAVRRGLIAAGTLVMLYAVGGALADGDVNKVGVPAFLIALIVLHDGVFLPVVLAAGVLIGRVVAPRWRTSVRMAALVSLAVSLVALPFVLGDGRDPANPSALPLPYGRGLLLIVGLIWGVVVVRKGLERWWRRRHG